MEHAQDNPDPVQDQLELEFQDESAIRVFEQAELDRELEREHYAAEWEARHDYEEPDSAVAYDYIQHTEPKPLPQTQTVSGSAVSKTGYKFKWADTIKVEQVPWLWTDRIPLGALTILDGDPSVGKTTIGLDLMARLSVGREMPFDSLQQAAANSLVVSVEDSVAYTIAPRLKAAGADMKRVALLLDFPLFPSGLDRLRTTVKETKAKLVMIDPGLHMFDAEINPYNDAQTRKVVGGLAALAADTESAVVFVRHLTKAQRSDAMYRGGGSIAISATARSCLLAKFPKAKAEHPVLASYKNSLGLKPSTLTYEIVGGTDGISHVRWLVEVAMTADEALEGDLPFTPGGPPRGEDGSARIQGSVVSVLKAMGKASADEVRQGTGKTMRSVKKVLDELVDKAVVEFEEEKSGKKGRPKRVYRLRNPLDDDAPPEGPQESFE